MSVAPRCAAPRAWPAARPSRRLRPRLLLCAALGLAACGAPAPGDKAGAWAPTLGPATTVVPGPGLPADLPLQPANNNLDDQDGNVDLGMGELEGQKGETHVTKQEVEFVPVEG
jgi:hypothetical protein